MSLLLSVPFGSNPRSDDVNMLARFDQADASCPYGVGRNNLTWYAPSYGIPPGGMGFDAYLGNDDSPLVLPGGWAFDAQDDPLDGSYATSEMGTRTQAAWVTALMVLAGDRGRRRRGPYAQIMWPRESLAVRGRSPCSRQL